MKDAYEGEAVIPLNKRGTKSPEKLSVGNPICEAGLAIRKDGKTTDGGGGIRQKYCCPFRQSKTGVCPCNHKNWNNGKKNRGCTKYKAIPTDYRLSIDRSCSVSRGYTPCVQSVSVTIPASNPQVRNGCGCATAQARQTSIHWPTSPL